MRTLERRYHNLIYTEVKVGNAIAKVWHPNRFHSQYQVEFEHMTITDVPTLEEGISKAQNLLEEYPLL